MARHLLNLALALAASPLALASPTAAPAGPKVLTTRFSYKAVVPTLPGGSRNLDLWLPIPSDSDYQRVSDLTVSAPSEHRVTTEKEFGNRMVYVHAVQPKLPFEVTVEFTVERIEAAVLSGGAPARLDRSSPAPYLASDAMVPTGGRYGEIADDVTAGSSSALQKAHAAFNHVVATMQYDYKKESPHLGDGDVPFVCDYKKGNCSDLHSYLISLLRSEGVPAYLEYGFPVAGVPVASDLPLEGKIGGYHCWTWFRDEEGRWLPLDASDGRRWLDSNDARTSGKMFGNLIVERSAVAVSRGRDLVLEPAQKQGPRNYFIYPYAEADGNTVEAGWELTYKTLSLSGGDVQQQLDELHRTVAAQRQEIAALKASAAPKVQGPVAAASGEKVGVYVSGPQVLTFIEARQNGPGSRSCRGRPTRATRGGYLSNPFGGVIPSQASVVPATAVTTLE